MISVPSCCACWRSWNSNASAGGQLEQPSEVNSSTTTDFRLASGVAAGLAIMARAANTAPKSAIPSPRPASRKNGLVLAALAMVSGCRRFSIDIKFYIQHVFDFHSSASDGNRLNPKIRLLQFGASVIVARAPGNLKADLFDRAMQFQVSGYTVVLRRELFNARGFEADLRILLRVQHFGPEHGGLNLQTRGIGISRIDHLHLSGMDDDLRGHVLRIENALGDGSNYDVIMSETGEQSRFGNVNREGGTMGRGVRTTARQGIAQQSKRRSFGQKQAENESR